MPASSPSPTTPLLRWTRTTSPRRCGRFAASHRPSGAGSAPPRSGPRWRAIRPFAAAVQARVRDGLPDLTAALDAGTELPAVPAADVAAVAYVLAAADWPARVEAARRAAVADRPADEREPSARRREKRDAARVAAREDTARLRDEIAGLRRELDEARRALGRSESAARRAAQALEEAQQRAAELQAQRESVERDLSAEVRRLRARLRDAEASAAAARRGVRSDRDAQAARLRVLLDTVTAGAAGLRRELGLPAAVVRPVDLIADAEGAGRGSRARRNAGGVAPGTRRRRPGAGRRDPRDARDPPDRRRLQRHEARLRHSDAGGPAQPVAEPASAGWQLAPPAPRSPASSMRPRRRRDRWRRGRPAGCGCCSARPGSWPTS